MFEYTRKLYHEHRDQVVEVYRRVTRLPLREITSILQKVWRRDDVSIFTQFKSMIKSPGARNENRSIRRVHEVDLLVASRRFTGYLDVGCDDMSLTETIADNLLAGGPVYGTDIIDKSTLMESNGIIFRQTDGHTLPFSENCVELVSCFHSIHHFTDLDGMLSEIVRVLKPDGVLVIREHDCPSEGPTHDLISLMHVGWDVLKTIDTVKPVHMARSQAEWQSILGKWGFSPLGLKKPTIAPTVDRVYLQAFQLKKP